MRLRGNKASSVPKRWRRQKRERRREIEVDGRRKEIEERQRIDIFSDFTVRI